MSLFSGSTTIICGIQVFKACKHEFSFSKEPPKETMAVMLFFGAEIFIDIFKWFKKVLPEVNTNENRSSFLAKKIIVVI